MGRLTRHVELGDKLVDIEMPKDRFLKRLRGMVLSTRAVKFRGRDGEDGVAHLRARTGREATAILGPVPERSDLDLKEGDEVAIFARPNSLDGRPGLVAESVRSGDKSVEIDRPGSKKNFQSKQSDQGSGLAPKERQE